MKIRYLSVVAAVALVAACESSPKMESKQAAGSQGGGAATTTTTQATAAPMAAPGSQADFVANVGDRIFFDYDKSDLKPEARDTLGKWVAFLKKYPADKLQVQGNCDERGTEEYNLALGERRANSAKTFLVAQGIDAGRLSTISYGKERPAVLGHNEAAWSQNRRDVGVIQ
jgi:peptidoglycan-associated lipoprotein